jgi:hypothetical protein
MAQETGYGVSIAANGEKAVKHELVSSHITPLWHC